jgi:hypothetical protein
MLLQFRRDSFADERWTGGRAGVVACCGARRVGRQCGRGQDNYTE